MDRKRPSGYLLTWKRNPSLSFLLVVSIVLWLHSTEEKEEKGEKGRKKKKIFSRLRVIKLEGEGGEPLYIGLTLIRTDFFLSSSLFEAGSGRSLFDALTTLATDVRVCVCDWVSVSECARMTVQVKEC